MRSKVLIGMAALILSTSLASAQPGCRRAPNRLGSQSYSRGINAAAPAKNIYNPCSSNYDFGKNVRRREQREYPRAIVRH